MANPEGPDSAVGKPFVDSQTEDVLSILRNDTYFKSQEAPSALTTNVSPGVRDSFQLYSSHGGSVSVDGNTHQKPSEGADAPSMTTSTAVDLLNDVDEGEPGRLINDEWTLWRSPDEYHSFGNKIYVYEGKSNLAMLGAGTAGMFSVYNKYSNPRLYGAFTAAVGASFAVDDLSSLYNADTGRERFKTGASFVADTGIVVGGALKALNKVPRVGPPLMAWSLVFRVASEVYPSRVEDYIYETKPRARMQYDPQYKPGPDY